MRKRKKMAQVLCVYRQVGTSTPGAQHPRRRHSAALIKALGGKLRDLD